AGIEGEMNFIAHALGRRSGISGDVALDELLSGDSNRAMRLLRMGKVRRETAASLLAGIGDLVGIDDPGQAIARFDAMSDAAVARLAQKLRIPVSRPAVAASIDHDIDLWVRATPEGDDVALTLEGWTERTPAGPRLATLLGGTSDADSQAAHNEWAADEELRI